MRPGQQQNKQRMRGRGRKGPNPLSRSYESNGPDVKIRGTAQHIAEKYLTLARDASASGDRVMAENYLQHAEHYGRIVAAAQGSFQVQRDEREVEYDEDGEEIFDESADNRNLSDAPQPQMQPQPQMRENRDGQPREHVQNGQNGQGGQNGQNGQRDNTYQRENRDRGNRDGNREFQNRENRGERDGNRDQNREGNRDFQNRENRGENNRGENRGNREFNRENRPERNRDFNRENREQQNDRAAQGSSQQPSVPSGLGPQPFIGLPPAAPSFEAEPRNVQPREADGSAEMQPVVAPVNEEAPVVSNAEAGRADGEPRRRGRPRRVRAGEVEALASDATPEAVSVPAPAPVEAPAAAAEFEAPIAAAEDAPDGEVKAKRRPGRPRKKKVEDEASEEGGEHLPAFLMASNG